MSVEVGRCHVTIFGDDGPLRRKVATLGRNIPHRIRIPIGADTRAAERNVARLKAALRGLGRTTRIRIDSSGTRGSQSQVEKLRDTLRGLKGATVRVNARTEQGIKDLKALEREANSVASRAYRLSFTAKTAQARGELRRLRADALAAAGDARIRVEAETTRARAELSTFRAVLLGLRDRKIKIDVDTRGAVRAGAALRSVLDGGRNAMTRFNRAANTMRNVLQVTARVGIAGLIASLAPLAGMLTIGAAGLTALAAGAVLVGAAIGPSIVKLINHKVAAEALETASENLADQEDALAASEENLARVVEEGNRSVRDAAEARKSAREEVQRTEEQAAQQREDAQKRVEDQRQEVEKAESERTSNVAREQQRYRDLVAELDRTEEENARRLKEVRDAAKQADTDYFRVMKENAENLAQARKAVDEAREESRILAEDNARQEAEALSSLLEEEERIGEIREENAREEADARREILEEEQTVRDLREENAREEADALEELGREEARVAEIREDGDRRVAESRKQAEDVADSLAESERALGEERDELQERTEDLEAAQLAYNRAADSEPDRKRETARDAEDAGIRVEELQARLAELAQERSDALAAGDTGRAGELDREYRLAQNDLERAREERDKLREEIERLQNGGVSEELQNARNEVEAAFQARQEQLLQVEQAEKRRDDAEEALEEARAGIALARRERDAAVEEQLERIAEGREAYGRLLEENDRAEAAAEARIVEQRENYQRLREGNAREVEEQVERVAEGREAYRRLLEDNDRAENAAERRIAELRGEVGEVQEENAEREEEALQRRKEARAGIRLVEEENARSLLEGQKQANRQLRSIEETRAEGNERVRESEEGLKQAIEERRRTAQETDREIQDRLLDLDGAREDFRLAELQRDRDILDARRDVTEETKNLKRAQGEVTEAAAKTGAVLSASEQALLGALQSFTSSFTAAFAPARDSLNGLIVRILGLAETTLPYLGGVTLGIGEKLHDVFDGLSIELLSPEQQRSFKRFFDALPGMFGNAVSALTSFFFGLFNVFSVATPFVQEFFGYLAEKAQDFLDWSQSVAGERSLTDFFEDAKYFAGIFVDVLVDVVRFLNKVGRSDQFKGILENVAEFVELLANNPEGILVALSVIRRIGDVLLFLLNIPGLGPLTLGIGTFLGTLAFFGGAALVGVIGSLTSLYLALRRLSRRQGFGWIGRALDALGRQLRGFVRGLTRFPRQIGNLLRPVGRIVLGALRGIPSLVGRLLSGAGRAAGRALSGVGRFVLRALLVVPRLVTRALRGVPGLVGRLFSSAVRAGGRALSFLGRTVAAALRGVGRIFASALRGIPRFVGRVFSSAVRAGGRALSFMGRVVSGALRGLGRLILSLLRGIPRLVGRIFSDAVRAGGRALSFMGRTVSGALRGVARFVSSALRGIPGIVGRLFSGAVRAAGRALSLLPRAVGNALRFAGRWFAPLTNAVTRIFGGRGVLLGILRGFVGRFGMGAIFGPAGVALQILVEFADEIQVLLGRLGKLINDGLQSLFGFRLDWFGPWLKKRLRSLIGAPLYDSIARILGADLGELISMLGERLRTMFEWVGESIIFGWLRGMARRAGEILRYLFELAKQAWQQVTDFFEIRSPSARAERDTSQIGEGMLRGFRKMFSRVRAGARQMAEAARVDLPAMRQDYVLSRRSVEGAGSRTGMEAMIAGAISGAVSGAPTSGDNRPILVHATVELEGKKLGEKIIEVSANATREARRSGYGRRP